MPPRVASIAALLRVGLACATSLVAPVTAFAQTPHEGSAVELYSRSVESYRAGRFAEAARLSREAYARTKEPALLYNLARACEGMDDLPCAIDAYERYLAVASPHDARAIQQRIATHRKILAEKAKLAPTSDSPSAPDAPTAPEATSPPESTARPAPASLDPAPPAPAAVLPWIVAGVGAAGIAAGVALFFVARGEHQAAVDDPVQQTAAEKQSTYETIVTVDRVVVVTGVTLAIGGVVWALIDRVARPAPAPPAIAVAVAPRAATLTVRF